MEVAAFVEHLTYGEAVWLLPVVYAVHFLEEHPRFPLWATDALRTPYTTKKFLVENAVLWSMVLAWVLLNAYSPGQAGTILTLSAAFGFLTNVVFHAAYTLRTGVYSPGTVTACLFFAPTSIHLYYLAVREGRLTVTTAVSSAVIGLATLPIVVAVVHGIIDGRIPPRWVILAALPPVLLQLASALLGRATVMNVMVYAGPLVLLPLVLKSASWLKGWRR
ncbi:MAG: HXXEE domain-containing protein [Acidobacteria bacterium]|nr:HXXEE domain-containing protein [Acidobacteriota bacterium]